nr:EOG090X04IO [Lepidurus arcticus]
MSRKEEELSDIIAQQKEQLTRYKRKLQDLVQAYKSLQKEKEAIKSSFEAVTTVVASGNKTDTPVSNGTAANQQDSDVESNASQSHDPLPDVNEEESLETLKARISTLSTSLSVISKEKSRIESAFQNDRKQLLHEKDELQKSLAAACQQADASNQQNTAQIQSLKSQLADERASHERELEGQQITIKEVQRSYNEERQKCQALERKNHDLSSALETAKINLEKASKPDPLISQLQSELDDLKSQYSLAFQKETDRVSVVERQAKEQIGDHETKVALLESKLAELSSTLGEYEQLRQQDMKQILALKEQLSTATTIELESSPNKDQMKIEENFVDFRSEVQKTITKMLQLKGMLAKKNECLKDPIDLESFFLEKGLAPGPPPNHAVCLMDFERLKHELDCLRKEKDVREVERLSSKAKSLEVQLAEAYRAHQESMQKTREAWMTERESFKEEMKAMERDSRRRRVDLEYQLDKQRERTLALLEDKDKEIANLKTILSGPSLTGKNTPDSVAVLPTQACPPLDVALELTGGTSASGGQILHYVEDLSRKEVELSNLRKIRRQLENALRELQLTSVAKEDKTREEIEKLKEHMLR